jgi:hypothetical protein
MFNIYEIYTKNPVTGQRGWDIMFVVAFSEQDASTVRDFDEVIFKEGSMSDDKLAVMRSGLAMTEAVYQAVYGVAA